TPTEDTWPGISSNEDFRSYLFPQYRSQALINHVPRLDTEGIDLLSVLLLYDTRSRISSEAALHHPYFLSLGEAVHILADTASVFSLREVQLQKDPGHRSSVFQPLGKKRIRHHPT
ncbi:Cyclin-dependent kinase 18, partial [Xenoophorus captivus]